MFDYCVRRLNMSEDEAYRRIEAARLVRRFPRLLEMLGAGQVSLSVAVLLKARLTDANHRALLAAVSGKTVVQAREVLAAWFPQPDVMPLLRKLPARSAPVASRPASTLPSAHQLEAVQLGTHPATAPSLTSTCTSVAAPASKPIETAAPMHTVAPPLDAAPSARPSRSISPLSPDRYKLQLTVTTDLKRKLDLARDLLRHAIPSGDLATIIDRALDLLLQQTLKRRFAAKRSAPPNASRKDPPESAHAAQPSAPTPAPGAPAPPASAPVDSCTAPAPPPAMPLARSLTSDEPTLATAAATPPPATRFPAAASPVEPPSAAFMLPSQAPAARGPIASRHIPNQARRAVAERDGLRCTWQAPDGTRCNSRAWLEHDHIIPRGKGGTHDPANGRILCQPHNRLSAERAYGQDTITRIIAHRRSCRPSRPCGRQPERKTEPKAPPSQ